MTAVLDRPTVAPTSCEPLAAVCGASQLVPLANGTNAVYANFDYAASAPALTAVADAVSAASATYASVHRGAGYLSQVSTTAYENARNTVSRFVDARPTDHTIFTRATTDSINLLARCVPGEVVVLDVEHHANLLPWELCGARIVSAPFTVDGALRAIEAELSRRPAALLAVTGASNVTGELLPIDKLARLAHRYGARIFVDAAQLAPHRRVSLLRSDIDYLAFSGHKLYAPFGAGVLVGRGDWLDAGDPYLRGGGATASVIGKPAHRTVGATWHCGPARHEAGSPNVLGAVAIAAACDALEKIGSAAIAAHEERLTQQLRSGLTAIDGVTQLSIWLDSAERVGIVAFSVRGRAPREVAEFLSSEHGIGVRDGKFCAHPIVDRLGHTEGAVRASIGLGTSSADVERLLGAIAELAART